MTASTLTPEELLDSLKRVIEPEMRVNIVDLGLIYGIELAGDVATIEMTLTSPNAPFRAEVEAKVRDVLKRRHPELNAVRVELVWEPAWYEHYMTAEGARQRESPILPHLPTPENPLSEHDVLASLHSVLDPEVGINNVDLGLVYGIALRDDRVEIAMTMTTRACPLQATIKDAVERVLRLRHPELEKVVIAIVWEPAWGVERISAAGRAQLGW
jgi:metal-sulfur cluster biosynthetic enzyme